MDQYVEMGAIICPVCGYIFNEDYISLKETVGTQIIQLTFIRQNSTPIQQTRLRKGNYILITPQEFIPLTSESIPGVIRELILAYCNRGFIFPY